MQSDPVESKPPTVFARVGVATGTLLLEVVITGFCLVVILVFRVAGWFRHA